MLDARRAGRVLGAVLAVIVLGVCGCGTVRATAPTSTISRDARDVAVQVVRRYVDAIQHDDLDAAMVLRCKTARIPSSERDQLLTALQRLRGQLGGFQVETAAVLEPTLPITSQDPALGDPVQVGYSLAVNGRLGPELAAVTVLEDGVRRICGAFPRQTPGLVNGLVSAITAKSGVNPQPQALMPDPPAGYSIVSDSAATPASSALPGETTVWKRVYQSAEGHLVVVAAGRYDTTTDAVNAAQVYLAGFGAGGVGRFAVSGAGSAIGMRALALAQAWVQPPSVGPFIDEVVGVYGTTAYEVIVGGLDSGIGHDVAIALTSSIDARSRI